jgi:hypothetical protein
MTWERLRNNFELLSASSLVKFEKQFRQCSLKKEQDPDICISQLQDFQIRLEELGWSITDNEFILDILNNMTDDYDLQLEMMKKRDTDKYNPLIIDEIFDDLSLGFERLTKKEWSKWKWQ